MASANAGLTAARTNKDDEYYTQLADIEAELRRYRGHFEGKTVLCNCDDPFESNFFKYFAMNFRRLGIKKLIASCYSGSPVQGEQLSLHDLEGMSTIDAETKRPYKIEITEIPDANGDGAIDLSDVGVRGQVSQTYISLAVRRLSCPLQPGSCVRVGPSARATIGRPQQRRSL